MHGRHIALFPLPGKSHLYQFLGLCPELVRRGHRVTIATIESLAKYVVQAGAEAVIFQPDRPMMQTAAIRGLPIDNPERLEESTRVFSRWLLNSAAMAVWQLDKFYRDNRPDLLIYEFSAYAGRILARRLRSPAIQYYSDFIHHDGYACWEASTGHNPPSIVEFSQLLDSFLWAYGFEEPNNFWHIEQMNLCQFPRAFQFDAESIDSRRFCFVGPFLDRPFRPMWKNHSGGKRVILVSAIAGSFDDSLFSITVDALSGSEFHVILSVGEHFPIGDMQSLPDNFEINRFASHLEILPHTDLHLYSGGPTSTLESLYFGVPLIAIPSLEHNYVLANRLAELGIALNLPLHMLTSQMVRQHVEAVLQDRARLDRVKRFQLLVRSSGGSAAAVDKVEEFLSTHAG